MTAEQRREIEEMLALFHELTEKVASAESTPKEFGTGMVLHRSETHTLQAIGRAGQTNVVGLARDLGITKGAISQMIGRLERKGLVSKGVAPGDRRGVTLELTKLGRRAYAAHETFHAEMHAAVQEHLGKGRALSERLQAIRGALEDLLHIVEAYERKTVG